MADAVTHCQFPQQLVTAACMCELTYGLSALVLNRIENCT